MNGFEKYTNYKTVLTVNAFITCKGKILMLKRAGNKKVDPGLYSGIGGKVEPHESFYSALGREIEEETGIKEFRNERLFSVTQHPYPPTDSEWVNLYFFVEIDEQVEIKPTEDGTFHWLELKELLKLPTPQDIHDYLEIISRNPKAFIFGFFDHDKEGKLIEKAIKII